MIRDWVCPECKKTDRTDDDGKGTRFHVCPKMRGLSVPFVLAGTKARLVLREREDYVGSEQVQLDPERKRPLMSLSTERENGNDLIVYAPAAQVGGKAG
jgi:hypothetical protein